MVVLYQMVIYNTFSIVLSMQVDVVALITIEICLRHRQKSRIVAEIFSCRIPENCFFLRFLFGRYLNSRLFFCGSADHKRNCIDFAQTEFQKFVDNSTRNVRCNNMSSNRFTCGHHFG